LGVAVVGAVIVPQSGATAEVLATRMPLVLWYMAPLLAVAFVLTLALPGLPLRQSAHVAEMA
jgi:hypothetical protein